jgi:uncharacterized FlaG/YvyC family protein
MDVQFVPKTTLPSGPQAAPQPLPANNADNAATKPILAESARAVTVSANVETPESERRQDRIGKQGDETVSPQKVLDSLRLTNVRTQLDFNRELDTVVLQVVDTRTEEVLETIPSEELVRQLKQIVGPRTSSGAEDSGGGLVIDRSI